ncbi:hypothetical protein B0T22DRAFT_460017 [Podospora appendiculata]|uniref:Uncharacterized protein n=1 Tax=Podospora appendiculata TaxID=314037 RepID=A0AAE0X9P9_9PEZI|nr:hypothetical protein B0T22DRAFT_460017 [Podospora appendiculata]
MDLVAQLAVVGFGLVLICSARFGGNQRVVGRSRVKHHGVESRNEICSLSCCPRGCVGGTHEHRAALMWYQTEPVCN